MLNFSVLHAQEDCSGIEILPLDQYYCRGDVVDIEVVLEPGVEDIEFFVFSDVLSYYGGYISIDDLVVGGFPGLCPNGTFPLFIDAVCSPEYGIYYGEFIELEIEVYDKISPGLFYYDAERCKLGFFTECGYTFSASVGGTDIPFDGFEFDLGAYEFPTVTIEMFNPFAPNDCANSSLEFEVTETCNQNPCGNYNAAASLNETIVCSGDIISLDFEGDISEIDFVELHWVNGTGYVEFFSQGFENNTFSWFVQGFSGECINGPQQVAAVAFCTNGTEQILDFTIDIYGGLDDDNFQEILFIDESLCVVSVFEPCGFSYETDPSFESFEGGGGFFVDTTDPVLISFTFTNEEIPEELDCDVIEGAIVMDCLECDVDLNLNTNSVCTGDIVTITVDGDESMLPNIFEIQTPDGNFFIPQPEFPMTFEWLVGNVGGCQLNSVVFMNTACGIKTHAIDIYPSNSQTIDNPSIALYQDCLVCLEQFCPEDKFEWRLNGVVDPNQQSACFSIENPSPTTSSLSVQYVDPEAPDGCFDAKILELELPCTSCPVIDLNVYSFPETDAYCLGEVLNLNLGPESSEFKYQLYFDDELIGSSATFSDSFDFSSCTEQHEIRAVVYCALNDFVIADHTINYTFYNDLSISSVSEDCFVEIIPECPDVTVFWSEGTQSGEGNVFKPEPGQTGAVTFIVANTDNILDCNQAIYEVEYACTSTGIEDDLQIEIASNSMSIAFLNDIESLKLFNLNGQEFYMPCSFKPGNTRCDMPQLMPGIYIVELISEDGNRFLEKVYLN